MFTVKFYKVQQKLTNHSNFLSRLIVFICTLLLIPTVLLFFSMNYSIEQLKKSKVSQTINSVTVLQRNFDNFLKDTQKIMIMILSDPIFNTDMLSSCDKVELSARYTEYLKAFQLYSVTFPDIDILCYFPYSGYIATDTTCNHISYLANAVSQTGDRISISSDDWNTYLSRRYPQLTTSKYLSYNYFGQDRIVASVSKIHPATKKCFYTVFFSIPLDTVFNTTALPADSFILLTDGTGKVLSQLYGKQEDPHTKHYFSISRPSNISNMDYVLYTPYDTYFGKIKIIRYIAVFLILVIIFLGLCCILLIQRETYKPVHDMILTIRKQNHDLQSKNELQMINEFINRISEENRHMQSSYKNVIQYARELSLRKLLNDDSPNLCSAEFSETLQKKSGKMILMIIRPEIYSLFFKKKMELLLWSVNNVFLDILNNFYSVTSYTNESSLHYLIIYPAPKAEPGNLCSAADKLYQFFKEKYYVNLAITISNEFTSPREAHKLHMDLEDIATYRTLVHSDGITRQCDIASEKYNFIQTAVQYRNNLHKDLLHNNLAELKQACTELFKMYEGSRQSLHMCKYHLFNIICPLLFSAQEYENDLYKNAEKYIADLCQCTTLESLHITLLDAFNSIITNREYILNEKDQLIIKKIHTYIEEHYTDSQLNMCSLSEYVRLSPKYLGSLYRCQTTEGIPQYLNRIRIEKAVELLMAGTCNCDEIALMVGFTNTHSFRRNFKQVTGLNPNEYKQQKLKQL